MAGDELAHELEYSKPGSPPALVLHDGQVWQFDELATGAQPFEGFARRKLYTLEPVLDASTAEWVPALVPEDQAEAVREAAVQRIAELERMNQALQPVKVRMLVDAAIAEKAKSQPIPLEESRAQYWKNPAGEPRYGWNREQARTAARRYIARFNRDRTLMEIGDQEVCALEQTIDMLEDEVASLKSQVGLLEAALGDGEALEWERAEKATARAAELERMNLTLAGVVDDLKKQRAEHEAATVTAQKVFAAQREELREAHQKLLSPKPPTVTFQGATVTSDPEGAVFVLIKTLRLVRDELVRRGAVPLLDLTVVALDFVLEKWTVTK